MTYDNVWDLAYQVIEPYDDGFPTDDKATALAIMNKAVEAGQAFWMWNQDENVAFYCLIRSNQYKIEPHIFSQSIGSHLLRAIKEFPDLIWDNTQVKKIEVNTANRSLVKLLPKLGWRKEGIRRDSLIRYDGTTRDLFCYGQIRPKGKEL